jgi:hypothetical protein
MNKLEDREGRREGGEMMKVERWDDTCLSKDIKENVNSIRPIVIT